MTFSGKTWLVIILKSNKGLGLHRISRRYIFDFWIKHTEREGGGGGAGWDKGK